jgi:uncharacterized protein YhbP (UPF0306 family)
MGAIQNPGFISTDESTSHSTKLPNNGSQVAGYAALRRKFLASISSICSAAKFSSRLAFERTLNS